MELITIVLIYLPLILFKRFLFYLEKEMKSLTASQAG